MSPGQRGEVLEAAWRGSVGGAALLVGALLGLYVKVGLRVIGLVMAFGAGVLISAVAFELTEEAYRSAGAAAPALGLAAGSVVFFAGDWAIDRRGGRRASRPRPVRRAAWPSCSAPCSTASWSRCRRPPA